MKCGECKYFERDGEGDTGSCQFTGKNCYGDAIVFGFTKVDMLPFWCGGSFEPKEEKK